MNANRFFQDSHWLEIWKNDLCPSMGPNGGSVAMDSVYGTVKECYTLKGWGMKQLSEMEEKPFNVVFKFLSRFLL
jgi:hypothetical protein